MKADILLEQNVIEHMVDHIHESMGGFNIKVRLSSADMNPIPGTLAYNVEDVVIETKGGSVRVPTAGVLDLNVSGEELAEKIKKKTNGDAVEIIDVKVAEPPDDFKYGRNSAKYTLSVSYLTDRGNNMQTELKFDSINFIPSSAFTDQVNELT